MASIYEYMEKVVYHDGSTENDNVLQSDRVTKQTCEYKTKHEHTVSKLTRFITVPERCMKSTTVALLNISNASSPPECKSAFINSPSVALGETLPSGVLNSMKLSLPLVSNTRQDIRLDVKIGTKLADAKPFGTIQKTKQNTER